MEQGIKALLNDIAELEKGNLTKQEFLDAFKTMVEMIKNHQTENKSVIGSIDSKYASVVNDIKKNYNKDMEDVKAKAMEYCMEQMSQMIQGHEGRMMEMENKMGKIRESMPMMMTEKLRELSKNEILPLIPQTKELEKNLVNLGTLIRDGLEKLKGKERLDKSAIAGLQEALDELKAEIKRSNNRVIGASGGGGHIVKSYDLSGSLNGVLKTFSLPSFWRVIDVKLSSVPTLRLTTDYTVDGSAKTITFTSEIDAGTELATGQSCIVIYSE